MRLEITGTTTCDVLIIGCGGAGLRCAVEILGSRPQTNIIAVTKVPHAQKSHTSTAQGGLGAVDPNDPIDKPIYHMFDTWKGSDCMADQNVIKKIVESAWEQVIWLENHGMHFSRDESGTLSKRTFGGHTLNFGEASAYRAVFEADRTGKGIVDTLWGEALKRGVTFLNQMLATELIIRDDIAAGAILFSQKTGEFIRVLSKVTVLATGGSGQMFRITTNCRQNTGDGLSLILQAGLPVMDPEAVQFHPTGIVGPGILASETLRSVGGILRNRDLEPFMEKYAPKMKELAPRDLVARAIETEIREGRGILNPDHNIEHVWIDLRHLPAHVHDEQIPEVTSFFKKFVNIDPKTELCPVRPSNHYHMGGIPTNEFGEVEAEPGKTIKGLFAIGECAAASFHGFNRLGTNSLVELITMGKFAGQKALDYLKEPQESVPPEAGQKTSELVSHFLEAKGTGNLETIRRKMQAVMTAKVGVFRNEQGLQKAIDTLQELNSEASHCPINNKSLVMNQELVHRWELSNLLNISMVCAQAALRRKESRGAHFREDYPQRSPDYNDHTLVYMPRFGDVKFSTRPVDMSIHKEGGVYADKFGLIERKY